MSRGSVRSGLITLSRISASALNHPEIIWVGATSDPAGAHEEILQLQPDTILFEKTGSVMPMDVIEFLEEERKDVRIIGFSLENNELSLYHREHQTVVKAGDLLQLVLG
jgi:hypothetical protein